MKKIYYNNPNFGSNWLTTKLYNVPGILKYYKSKPAGLLFEEPFIVDSYGYLIKTIGIFQLSASHINLIQLEMQTIVQDFKYRIIYSLSNQPDIIEYQNEHGIERLRKYLKKLGWRGIESEYYDDNDERSSIGYTGQIPISEHSYATGAQENVNASIGIPEELTEDSFYSQKESVSTSYYEQPHFDDDIFNSMRR